MFRKVLFWCHLATGAMAGVVVFIMSVTGVLLAFERQVNSWVDSGSYIKPRSSVVSSLPLERLVDAVKTDSKQPPTITLRAEVNTAVEFSYGRERTLFVDPGTGRVLGEAPRGSRAFFSTVERLHRSLGSELRSGPGRPITGACNFGFLFLVVSGFYLWFPENGASSTSDLGCGFEAGLRREREIGTGITRSDFGAPSHSFLLC